MLKTCSLHRITYQDKLDPTCPQCALAGVLAPQLDAVPGEAGAPADESTTRTIARPGRS